MRQGSGSVCPFHANNDMNMPDKTICLSISRHLLKTSVDTYVSQVCISVGPRAKRKNKKKRTRARGGSTLRCGDPECAPIDTVVRIMFENQCGRVFGIPCEAWEVEETDLDESMPPTDMFHEWKAGLNERTGDGERELAIGDRGWGVELGGGEKKEKKEKKKRKNDARESAGFARAHV